MAYKCQTKRPSDFKEVQYENIGNRKIDISIKILQSFMEKDEVWAIIYKENGKAIGSLGIHEDKKRDDVNGKMIGYVLSKDYWGQGIMTEVVKCAINYAFDEMNLDILSIYHYPFNHRSRRVIEKCGFKYEGTLKLASKIYNGKVYDDVCYSITRGEYYEKE